MCALAAQEQRQPEDELVRQEGDCVTAKHGLSVRYEASEGQEDANADFSAFLLRESILIFILASG